MTTRKQKLLDVIKLTRSYIDLTVDPVPLTKSTPQQEENWLIKQGCVRCSVHRERCES